MSLPEVLATEIQKLEPSAMIELFVLDATALGGDVFRFHSGTNNLISNVVWQGETYVRFPVQIQGFEFNGRGQFPRPKLRVANVYSTITQIILNFNDLLGAKVTRKRTMAKFLDAVNFAGSVNPDADDTAEFPDDIYYVDRKSQENREVVEFELAASIDLAGVSLPRRQIIQNSCIWRYRGAECGYAGFPLWDQNDVEITDGISAEAETFLTARRTYLTSLDTLAAAEASLAAKALLIGPACDIILQETQYTYTPGTGIPSYGVSVLVQNNGNLYGALIGTQVAYWNGVRVSLGVTYRLGSLRAGSDRVTDSNGIASFYDVYAIERWAVDSGGCSTATSNYNAAITARDSAQTASDSALAALDTAFSSLPSDDPLYTEDICGKRLSSCKLRFGENEALPFGAFPGAGLIK